MRSTFALSRGSSARVLCASSCSLSSIRWNLSGPEELSCSTLTMRGFRQTFSHEISFLSVKVEAETRVLAQARIQRWTRAGVGNFPSSIMLSCSALRILWIVVFSPRFDFCGESISLSSAESSPLMRSSESSSRSPSYSCGFRLFANSSLPFLGHLRLLFLPPCLELCLILLGWSHRGSVSGRNGYRWGGVAR